MCASVWAWHSNHSTSVGSASEKYLLTEVLCLSFFFLPDCSVFLPSTKPMLTSYSVKFIRSVICPLEITPRLPVLQAHNLFTSYLSASLSSTLTLSPAALIVCTALSFTPSACPAACHILYSAHLQPGPVICQPTLSNIKAPVHKLQ